MSRRVFQCINDFQEKKVFLDFPKKIGRFFEIFIILSENDDKFEKST